MVGNAPAIRFLLLYVISLSGYLPFEYQNSAERPERRNSRRLM